MKYLQDKDNYILRLERGEPFIGTLLKFARERKITGGWVSAIGGVLWVELGLYDIAKKEYSWKKIEENLELLGASGSLALFEGEPVFHLHGTFSNHGMATFGGHIKEAEVAATCEVFIHALSSATLKRFIDEKNPVPLLDL